MRYGRFGWASVLILVLAVFAMSMDAQTGRRNGIKKPKYKSASKSAKEAQRRSAKARKTKEQQEREEEREASKAEREEKKNERNGTGIVAGEESDPSPVEREPATEASKDEKAKWIAKLIDKMKLEDEKAQDKFGKIALEAWKDWEKEDKRWKKEADKAIEDFDKDDFAKEQKEHTEKLKKVWDEADKDIEKAKILDESQTEQWKEATKEMRDATPTDRWLKKKLDDLLSGETKGDEDSDEDESEKPKDD